MRVWVWVGECVSTAIEQWYFHLCSATVYTMPQIGL